MVGASPVIFHLHEQQYRCRQRGGEAKRWMWSTPSAAGMCRSRR
uniref:Uncharacterized protein n=1 Tax=Triticum urartu TaxID=4572 RepID=A0A8R7P2J5_TRIUA